MDNRLTRTANRIHRGVFNMVIPMLLIFSSATTYGQSKAGVEKNENFINEINVLYQSNKWEEGKKMADIHLVNSPKDSDLKMLLGKYYIQIKKYDQARYELNKAMQFNANNLEAKQLLVGVETETKRYSSAICFVNELLEVNPYLRGLWKKKIELNRLQGNHVEAERLQKRISQIFPDDKGIQKDRIYQLEQEANAYQKADKLGLAIELKRNLLENNPDNQEYYVNLIDTYIKAGDDANALVFIERGLIRFPLNRVLINKNIDVLESQNRYEDVLRFIQLKRRSGLDDPLLKTQYDYFLLEAARGAQNSDPAILYGKIFLANPGNQEAFNVVFNDAIKAHQYDEALYFIEKHRKVTGISKELLLKELKVYRLEGNSTKEMALSRNLYVSYPADSDLKDRYFLMVMKDAKESMTSKDYIKAIENWKILLKASDDYSTPAKNGLYSAYVELGQHENALVILNDLVLAEPDQPTYTLKLVDSYYELNNYEKAVSTYENLLKKTSNDKKNDYLSGYGELMGNIIKEELTKQHFTEGLSWTQRWLEHDVKNELAFQYAINLTYRTKAYAAMLRYASLANAAHPSDTWFKVKLAEAMIYARDGARGSWMMMKEEIALNPFHEDVQKAFSQLTVLYGYELLTADQNEEGLAVANSGLLIDIDNKELKYLKGLAFEKMRVYDSAYYYQSFYEPGYLERGDFKQHLFFLNHKASRNEVAVYHLRSRMGDTPDITSISSFEYSRLGKVNTYVGRLHYAGRETGRGLQGQVEWSRVWKHDLYTKFDLALADQYFPKLSTNLSFYKQVNSSWEGEFGGGYRALENNLSLSNIVLGLTRETEDFRVSVRFNQFLLQDTWLFSLSTQARYYINSPKNYLLAMASLGSSPDVELLDQRFYDSFSVVNTMVGFGMGHVLTKNISAGLLGTWYNFQTGPTEDKHFKNLYHLNFQINVAF